MATVMGNMVKNAIDMNDEIIASNMLAAAGVTADAYLKAAMTSTTPELKAIYAANLNQAVGGHSALTELAVNRGWVNPYNSPEEQLSDVYVKSRMTVNEEK